MEDPEPSSPCPFPSVLLRIKLRWTSFLMVFVGAERLCLIRVFWVLGFVFFFCFCILRSDSWTTRGAHSKCVGCLNLIANMVNSHFLQRADVFSRNWFFKCSEFVRKLCLGQAVLFWVEMSDPTQVFWNSGSGHPRGGDCRCVLATCLLPPPPRGLVLLRLLMGWFAAGAYVTQGA